MFCPKCGADNLDTGKFCRSCGTDLGNVSEALSGRAPQPLVDRKGKKISWEGALSTMFMGAAFLVIAIVLGVSGRGGGWWFWMLIPAFTMLGSGLAKYIQLKKNEDRTVGPTPFQPVQPLQPGQPVNHLPPAQTNWVQPESRYKTGDLVPPSVTDATTRHLEIDSEGKTMTLPKK
jgi:hypothetical protein